MQLTSNEPETHPDGPPVVLFLCTRNSARSQIAEAWLRRLAGDRFKVASAGLMPSEIHPLTVQVMEEVGISLDGQRSKPVSEFLGRVAVQHIFIVCEIAEQNCPRIWPFGGELTLWPFDDPAVPANSEAEQLMKFREVRDSVKERIQKWLDTQEA